MESGLRMTGTLEDYFIQASETLKLIHTLQQILAIVLTHICVYKSQSTFLSLSTTNHSSSLLLQDQVITHASSG